MCRRPPHLDIGVDQRPGEGRELGAEVGGLGRERQREREIKMAAAGGEQ